MKQAQELGFDVVIGNPPYQMKDGGNAASAVPIYQKFVEQAKRLNPKHLVMIIPSRWFTGGRGLDDFRDAMLHDSHIASIHDYPNASDCFPGVEIKGGVCYFIRSIQHRGECEIATHRSDGIVVKSSRPLLEDGMKSFIRYTEQVSVLRKVRAVKEASFADIVSANDPFGYDVREAGSYKRVKPQFSLKAKKQSIEFYYNGWRKDGVGYIDSDTVRKNMCWINEWKLLVPQAWGAGDPTTDWVRPFIARPNSVCSETYMLIGPCKTKNIAENILSYTQTKFFHFLVSIIKITQHCTQGMYSLVPMQDFSKPWTDAELYKKYKLTKEEISFIESMIRPMDAEEKK